MVFSPLKKPSIKGDLPSSGGDQWLAVEMMESDDGWQKNRGIPKWMGYITENPIRIHDFGGIPYFFGFFRFGKRIFSESC